MRNWDYTSLSISWSEDAGVVRSNYHVADILPAATKGALLALVVDAYEKGFAASGTRTIVILVTLGIVL